MMEDTEDKKLWTPQIITGGKGPTEGGNWLNSLDVGTVFLVKSKKGDPGLQLFRLVWKKKKAVRLENPENPNEFGFFDSDLFCKFFDFFVEMDTVENDD